VEHGVVLAEAYKHTGSDLDAALKTLEEDYAGAYESLEAWAEEFLEDTGALRQVPESLRPYIDLGRWANDAELCGDVWTTELCGKVHVFWNR
jgi:antirestriction protein